MRVLQGPRRSPGRQRIGRIGRLGGLGAVAFAAVAHAEPQLAALAPAADARESVAIGPSGEVYEPDGHGAWIRKRATEIALAGPEGGAHGSQASAAVVAAARAGSRVLALTHDGPPFRLARDGWTVVHLGQHAKPLTVASPRPLAAIGKALFALDDAREPVKLPDAPAPIVAAAASASGVVIETDAGLARLEGKRWKPITGAPHHVAALLSDRFAMGDRGLVDLRTQKALDWPTGAKIVAITASDDGVLVVAERGKAFELWTVSSRGGAAGPHGRGASVATEPIPIDAPATVVGVAGDRAGRVVVALRDGRLAVREKGARGTWSTVRVEDALSPARPGSPPATQAADAAMQR